MSRHFKIEVLDYNVTKPHRSNWCYINYLRVGNLILLPQLTARHRIEKLDAMTLLESNGKGIEDKFRESDFIVRGKEVEEDYQAIEHFKRYCPDCTIIPVSCPHIVAKGGALNCITWTIKREFDSSALPNNSSKP